MPPHGCLLLRTSQVAVSRLWRAEWGIKRISSDWISASDSWNEQFPTSVRNLPTSVPSHYFKQFDSVDSLFPSRQDPVNETTKQLCNLPPCALTLRPRQLSVPPQQLQHSSVLFPPSVGHTDNAKCVQNILWRDKALYFLNLHLTCNSMEWTMDTKTVANTLSDYFF